MRTKKNLKSFNLGNQVLCSSLLRSVGFMSDFFAHPARSCENLNFCFRAQTGLGSQCFTSIVYLEVASFFSCEEVKISRL